MPVAPLPFGEVTWLVCLGAVVPKVPAVVDSLLHVICCGDYGISSNVTAMLALQGLLKTKFRLV
jgi:hypothetical protein